MSAIVGNDPMILKTAEKIYYKESVIIQKKSNVQEPKNCNEEKTCSDYFHGNNFMKFLKRDEREKIKEIAESVQSQKTILRLKS